MTKVRVLLSAFACDPYFGSDEEVGWQWARQLSDRGFDVSVVTRKSQKAAIEAHVAKTGECGRVRFIYVDLDGLHAILKRVNRRNHLYYYIWQWYAFKAAVAAHRVSRFDLVHHVTWVSFRQPSFMWALGIPFIFGPVAGGDEIPKGYAHAFSARQRGIEFLRGALNALVRFDPMMRLTYARASRIFLTSEGHRRRVPAAAAARARVELAIGCDTPPASPDLPARRHAGPAGGRLLFVGRCIGLKGMDIGLRVFAAAHRKCPGLTLTIIGDGVDRPRWQRLAQELGVADSVQWLGWLSKAEVMRCYPDYDMLFYPSLRDSGGFVVLEALQGGLPVVCFKLGGPGVVVDDSCGAAVEAGANIDETITRFADAVLRTLARTASDSQLPGACRARVARFSWSALIDRIYGDPSDLADLK